MLIVDAHTHIGSCMSAIHFTNHQYPAEDLVNEMDRNNVSKAVLIGGGEPHKINLLNKMTLAAIKKYPNRFIGFVRVNPLFPEYMEILKKYIEKHNFKGIKLHPTQDSYHLLDPRVFKVIEAAIVYHIPVLIHSGSIPYAMPGQIADLASLYPESRIIMAHSGKLELWQHVLPSAKRINNLYLEFSFMHLTSVRKAIDNIGADKVIFGSNWPAGSMRPWIEGINKAGIFSLAERKQFLGKNILKVIEGDFA